MQHVISASIAHNTTLANTNNRRINNKLDTRAYTQAASCCVGMKNGLEIKPKSRIRTPRHRLLNIKLIEVASGYVSRPAVTRCRSRGSRWVKSLWRAQESQRVTGGHMDTGRGIFTRAGADRRSLPQCSPSYIKS